ncbi:SH3 domain-containing protein, partial [Cellulophaga sp. Z1A5H]
MKIYMFFCMLLVFSCKIDNKTNQEQKIKNIESVKKQRVWEGIYTYASYYEPQEETKLSLSADYILIINSESIMYITGLNEEYYGEITKKTEEKIILEIDFKGTKEKIEIQYNGGNFKIIGNLVKQDIEEHYNRTGEEQSNNKELLLPLNKIYSFYAEDGRVNSENGLVIRKKPSLNSQKIATIPHNKKIKIFASTKIYDYITLSNNNKIVGEWKHIFYKNSKGKQENGYVFDSFIIYDFENYDYSSSYENKKENIDVYNEEQFFQNIKNNVTLNIKSKRLNLAKYLDENTEIADIPTGKLNSDLYNGLHIHSEENKRKTFLIKGYTNVEIKSDYKTEIITYPIQLSGLKSVTFNNLAFKKVTLNDDEAILYIDQKFLFEELSEYLFFINIKFFSKIQFSDKSIAFYPSSENSYFFQYCDFIKNASISLLWNHTNVSIDKCKFYELEDWKAIYMYYPSDSDKNRSRFKLTNSYIGNNKY